MKQLLILYLLIFLLLISCKTNPDQNTEQIKADVLKTVKAHNYAWSVLEDAELQKQYVHPDVIFIPPPYNEIKQGIDQYMADYRNWMEHATVYKFEEINPQVILYGQGKFALVTYTIDMAFKYYDNEVPHWRGVDHMTLVNEKGRWMITSDMYGRFKEND